jgi:hypothetical protein
MFITAQGKAQKVKFKDMCSKTLVGYVPMPALGLQDQTIQLSQWSNLLVPNNNKIIFFEADGKRDSSGEIPPRQRAKIHPTPDWGVGANNRQHDLGSKGRFV